MPGKFELYRDVQERFRFCLKSDGGEKILTSEGYEQKVFALDAIVSIMKNASEAALIDQTLPINSETVLDDASTFEWEDEYEIVEYEPSDKKQKKKAKRAEKKKAKKAKKSKRSKSEKKKRKSKKR